MTRYAQTFDLGGLTFASTHVLGDWPLAPSSRVPDVAVSFGNVASPAGDVAFQTSIGDEELVVTRAHGGHTWQYPDGVRIWVQDDGTAVRANHPAHYDIRDVATYLLGPIFGFLLRKRGVICLHASTVRVRDKAWALIGPAGAGKSTLAATLVQRGASLVAEDVSPLDPSGPTINAGLPLVKLWPDSAARFGDLPLLTPNWDKHFLPAPTQASRLHGIIELGESGGGPLSARDLTVCLVGNVYGSYALTAADRAADLAVLSKVAAKVEGFRMQRAAPELMASQIEEWSQ